MTVDPVGTGRCVMNRKSGVAGTWRGLVAGVALAALPVLAAEAPESPLPAQATYQVLNPQGLAARLQMDQASPVRDQDPAIFTELSPVTASEPAVRLPEDQRDDE